MDDINIELTREEIDDYSNNNNVIDFLRNKLVVGYNKKNYLPINVVKRIIPYLLTNTFPIYYNSITSSKRNKIVFCKLFEETEKGLILKNDILMKIIIPFKNYIAQKHNSLRDVSEDEPLLEEVQIAGINGYRITKDTEYGLIRKLNCDELGMVDFFYDFKNADVELSVPQSNNRLQRCQVQILGEGVKFDYPIEYSYRCPNCQKQFTRKLYDTIGWKGQAKCDAFVTVEKPDGSVVEKPCNTKMYPDEHMGTTKDAHLLDIGYVDEDGRNCYANAITFRKPTAGFFECVLYKNKNPNKTDLFHIVDIKPVKTNECILPERKKDENYLFTLQKCFDKFIHKQTGLKIYGMYPIKIALIMQSALSGLHESLKFNIQIVGDKSTGKSMILTYYGYLLSNHLHMTTNGLSVSVAGLRGTKKSINLMGTESSIVTLGFLGSFKTIHIDEAGENKELVKNLKTFLMQDNYSYDRAGATGIFHQRTAHVNVSENLDYTHLAQYRGSIRKMYKDDNFQIDEIVKPDWDEEWDLHAPLHTYTENQYLYKAVKEHRTKLMLSKQFWIDGYDYALHERFPFYFYLVNEKKDKNLQLVVDRNSMIKVISDNLELIRELKSDNIKNYFEGLEFTELENKKEIGEKVTQILEAYDIHIDSRMKTIYMKMILVSAIVNGRKTANEQDYKLLQWIIENTNCRLDIADAATYDIKGAPDLAKMDETETQIEQSGKDVEDMFGMPSGEFD